MSADISLMAELCRQVSFWMKWEVKQSEMGTDVRRASPELKCQATGEPGGGGANGSGFTREGPLVLVHQVKCTALPLCTGGKQAELPVPECGEMEGELVRSESRVRMKWWKQPLCSSDRVSFFLLFLFFLF